MTPHDPAACHDCGKETCVASLSGGLLDRLDCARAKSARLEAIADALGADLEEALSYVPEYFRDKYQIGVESLAAWRKARP